MRKLFFDMGFLGFLTHRWNLELVLRNLLLLLHSRINHLYWWYLSFFWFDNFKSQICRVLYLTTFHFFIFPFNQTLYRFQINWLGFWDVLFCYGRFLILRNCSSQKLFATLFVRDSDHLGWWLVFYHF